MRREDHFGFLTRTWTQRCILVSQWAGWCPGGRAAAPGGKRQGRRQCSDAQASLGLASVPPRKSLDTSVNFSRSGPDSSPML